MNKFTLHFVLFALLLCTSSAFAQKGVKLGAFIIPQGSILYNDFDLSLDDDEYRLSVLDGIAGGLSLGYGFNDYIGIHVNAIYSQQGGKYTTRRNINERNNYVTRLEYLKVPLLLSFNSNPNNHKVVFVLQAGAQLGILTRAWEYNDNPVFEGGLPSTFSNFPSTYETYQPISISLVGQIGFDVRLTYDMIMNVRLIGDYTLADVEDKDLTFRITENGGTMDQKYWEWARGFTRNAETLGITGGLVIGLTYLIETD